MCVDFGAVKKISVKNRYPIPCIDDLLGYLKDANYFTKLDCEVVIIRFILQKVIFGKPLSKQRRVCLNG